MSLYSRPYEFFRRLLKFNKPIRTTRITYAALSIPCLKIFIYHWTFPDRQQTSLAQSHPLGGWHNQKKKKKPKGRRRYQANGSQRNPCHALRQQSPHAHGDQPSRLDIAVAINYRLPSVVSAFTFLSVVTRLSLAGSSPRLALMAYNIHARLKFNPSKCASLPSVCRNKMSNKEERERSCEGPYIVSWLDRHEPVRVIIATWDVGQSNREPL